MAGFLTQLICDTNQPPGNNPAARLAITIHFAELKLSDGLALICGRARPTLHNLPDPIAIFKFPYFLNRCQNLFRYFMSARRLSRFVCGTELLFELIYLTP